ncbi:MAG: bifunctional hydroxymethylpyrimidine kinase/phosphomethylpyrimidine kinase [Clostridiales bacterium]|nr:bifunctional hydroxymethylpyrimidine kinase/phosphomethylpyrimidine kinase [Clostridiales bacterium]
MGILVIGASFVDIKGYPNAQYIPGGRNAGRVIQVHGGVGRNVVEDIANVELRPIFLTVLDDSGTSTDVIEKLKKHQVDMEYAARAENGLGTWLAIFDNQGDVIGSISNRPDLSALEEVLDTKGDEIFSKCDSVVVEFDIEVDLLKKVFALAEKYGKKVYAVVSNMSIALARRDLLKRVSCFVCNLQEAGLLFSEDYEGKEPFEMQQILEKRILSAQIPQMVVTMGVDGAVFAEKGGTSGFCASQKVDVIDTTGAGDSFFAGVAIGLTYGKTLQESVVIGTRLASSVISTKENVCPRFLPEEFDLVIPTE